MECKTKIVLAIEMCYSLLQIRHFFHLKSTDIFVSYFSSKKYMYVVSSLKKQLAEGLLMSTHNIIMFLWRDK